MTKPACPMTMKGKRVRRDEVVGALQAHWSAIREYGAASLTLFGSVARDEATEASDVDLLVEFDRPTGYLGLLTLKYYLEDLLGCPVDLGTLRSLPEVAQTAALKDAVRVGSTMATTYRRHC